MSVPTFRFLASVSIWGVAVFLAWAIGDGGAAQLWSKGMTGMIVAVAMAAALSGAVFYPLWRRGGSTALVAACLTTVAGLPCFLLLCLLAAVLTGAPQTMPDWTALVWIAVLGVLGNLNLLFHSLPAMIVWIVGSVLVEYSARPSGAAISRDHSRK